MENPNDLVVYEPSTSRSTDLVVSVAGKTSRIMTDQPDWIAEGFRTFQDEVLGKGWPDSPELRTLIEVAFYGGANWIMHVIGDEGYTLQVLERIARELEAQQESAKQRAGARKQQ